MAKAKTEQKLRSELLKSQRIFMPDAFFYKIPDIPIFADSKFRFAPEKPFDLILIWKGKTIVIETKVHKKETAWPMSKVKDCQIEGLLQCNRNGVDAYIMINVRIGLGKNRVNFCALLSIEEFMKYKKKQKSIKVEILQAMKTLTWQKFEEGEYYWNVDKLIK